MVLTEKKGVLDSKNIRLIRPRVTLNVAKSVPPFQNVSVSIITSDKIKNGKPLM